MQVAFEGPIEVRGDVLTGAWRTPRQMLSTQVYEGHTSIHDDATARRLGFSRGTIEGPTHFSQFAPLCAAAWSSRWLESGCISAHYRNASFDGERVRASMTLPKDGATHSTIWMERGDGTEILRGTASVGPDNPPSELEQRIRRLEGLEQAVVLRDIRIGMKTERQTVRMAMDQEMGALYPFSLADKLKVITERSPWYTTEGALRSPWGRPIIPIEMISVLLKHAKPAQPFPVRGPSVALFADQEIRLIAGPLFVGESYDIEHEVVALSGSRRTESMWVSTRVYARGSDDLLATMLLNSAVLKESYANYEVERAAMLTAS
jgi:hypothetical protein